MTEIDCKWNLTFQGLNIKPAKFFKENKLHFTFSSAIKFAARVVWEDVAHDLQTTKYHLQLLIINDNKFQPKNLFLQSRLDTKKKMFVCVENHNCKHFNVLFLLMPDDWNFIGYQTPDIYSVVCRNMNRKYYTLITLTLYALC